MRKYEYMLNKEYRSDHGCERTSMAAKYKMFVTVPSHFIGIYKNKYVCS